jgi:hypothetical protein
MSRFRTTLGTLMVGPATFVVCLGAFTLAGCERKERVIDVQTPAVDVKVDRNIDTGRVDVEANRK